MPTSAEDIGKAISSARKRRVVKASITRLSNRLGGLEGDPGAPNTQLVAQQMLKSLETYSSDFKLHHFVLVDLIEDEGDLYKEQEALDTHDDTIADLVTRLNLIISPCVSSTPAEPNKVVTRRLNHLKKCEEIAAIPIETADICLVRQREEQLLEFKKELGDVSQELLALDLDDEHELMVTQSQLEREIFDNSLRLKRILSSIRDTPTTPTSDNLSDPEKLVYLRHSVKDGSAKSVIEGLSRTGEHYTEAIECLQVRYNKPRLIHQAHVKKILEIPVLKQGSGKELRQFHDLAQQHLRALKAMGHEPSGSFITSTLELKLDTGTMFEWQKHSQASTDVPHYQDLLDFISLRVHASEASISEGFRKAPGGDNRKHVAPGKGTTLFAASTGPEFCVMCKNVKHPLYSCPKFKAMDHDKMIAAVKSNDLCMNCLKYGHFVKQCQSLYRCRDCQKPHHTLLHVNPKRSDPGNTGSQDSTKVRSLAATTLSQCSLLMTCQVMLVSNGLSTKARALLDSGSTMSFVSERLARTLHLPRSRQLTKISGIAGLSHGSSSHFVTNFRVSSCSDSGKTFDVSAIIIPRVTCDLPSHPVPADCNWSHLEGLQLADPDFGRTDSVDLLLGVDMFVEALLHGRRVGPTGCLMALETKFGWVLAGSVDLRSPSEIISCQASLLTGDDLLRSFWEVETIPDTPVLTTEEREVVHHFNTQHYRKADGRFVVPLPKKNDLKDLGESRSQAVRRFLTMERSLHSRKQFAEFAAVVEEYFTLGHAERVPDADLYKPQPTVFCMPMHAVRKDSSSTTKLGVVFDASAKSTTGVSLNDLLMVSPTVHPPLIDVLLRFRSYPVGLSADVSKMYRAVELVEEDRDYH